MTVRGDSTTTAPPPIGSGRTAYGAIVAAASGSIARRTSRVEHRLPPIALDTARARPVAVTPPERPVDAATTPRRPAVSGRLRTIPEASLAEVERSITAKLEQRLDQKITATIKATLGTEVELSQTMTDRVYDALYDRMVLEKERLA